LAAFARGFRAGFAAASVSPSVAALRGARFGLAGAASAEASIAGAAFLISGLRPSVRISVIRTMVWSWRWPRVRLEFCRRRFLKTMIFAVRFWPTISPATVAPETSGLPSEGSFSPPTRRT
jgi:hypothetical protein